MVELKCDMCGKVFERKQCKVNRTNKHYCSNECRYKGQGLPKHLSWEKNGVVHLEITEGNVVLLDEVDRDLTQYNWQTRRSYAARKDNERRHIYMHRLIIERKLGRELDNNEVVDHINGNGFDNRRANIRVTTAKENSMNVMKPVRMTNKRKSTSRYKGVSFDREKGKWRARITDGGKIIHLGYFDNEIDAAIRYDKAAIAIFDHHAKLNFPTKWYAWKIHRKSGCAYMAEA